MQYNLTKKRIKKSTDCVECPYFDKVTLKCNGSNKNCFVYDPVTKRIIDGITGLPINIRGVN